jgi:putative spermidine/putrescine transport system permease protein/spermidine/putrescine transport system permease protein
MGVINMSISTYGHVNEQELKNHATKERRILLGLTYPAVFCVITVMVIPVAWLFYLSFIGSDGNFSLEHYQRMLDSKSYARIFLMTFKVSLLTTVICICIGYPLAYFLSQLPARVANICMLSVLLPFWTSLLVRTYSWLVLLQRKGIINQAGMDMGIINSGQLTLYDDIAPNLKERVEDVLFNRRIDSTERLVEIAEEFRGVKRSAVKDLS